MEDENTQGGTAQMVGAGALGFAVVALLLSIFGGMLALCCGPIALIGMIVSALSAVVSVGAVGFGVTTSQNEELSEEQAGKAKMGAGLGAGGLVLNIISIAISCGPFVLGIFFAIISNL